MIEKLVPSAWIKKEGHRLDCGPYLSGAVEAKLLLEGLPVKRAELHRVTTDLINAGRIKRHWVTSPEEGVPFLSSTDILDADLRFLSLISKRSLRENPKLTIHAGWILVTRAGTIGRMAFARAEMDGMACSEDVLRVIPDQNEIRAGYLYAFLCSRFGLPLVVGGTYGAIIQHIEPQHIADLPVPLAPDYIQDAAHKLVEEAGELRTKASFELRDVIKEIEHAAGLPVIESRYDGPSPDVSIIRAQTLGGRMDGLFHSNYHRSVLDPLLRLPDGRRTTVAKLATRLFWPPMFKRIHVDDKKYGVPFFGTSALMRADPDASYLLAKRTPGIDDLIVHETTVLVPGSGQLNGIIGHAVLPFGDVLGAAVTHDAVRIFTSDKATAGYLFACLSSEYGRRQLKARAFGSSIPHLDGPRIGATVLPRIDDNAMRELGLRAFQVASNRHEAVRKEREAREIVEHWIVRKGGV